MRKFISKIGYALFSRRLQKRRAIFIIAALPLIFYSIWGWEYGISLFYLIPALVSITQFFYPTMFSWIIISSLYFIWTALYLLAVLIDIFKKLSGNLESSLLFVDLSDTVFFLSYIALAAFIFVGLLKAKPKFEISERSLPSSGSIGGDSELKRP